MSLHEVAAARWPKLTRALLTWAAEWNRVGEQTAFYAKTLRGIPNAVIRYKVELMRVLAQMSLGVGALAAIGGTVMVVPFLVMAAGGVVGVVGHFNLSELGVDALGGFFASFVDTRTTSPFMACIGLAATVGAGTTAQLGAMRINEEIDALEVMGISPITYLAATRVIAGVVAALPIFLTSLVTAYLVTEGIIVGIYHQPTGVYEHYFNTFLDPYDVMVSTLEVILSAIAVMLIHTYYGMNASGGPAGVGEATGRAVRASLVTSVFITISLSMAIYGRSGHFHLAP
ncbi:MAG: ABC transporter permease [Mycobacterium sp.]|uniref:ABC transporter permease n=1 Tax=Mycobacterium sp. TaxID=1785 RepID=UPI00260D8849|nr:ABC transporter permease [Mycobacterium sp.]MDI3313931.1 ABC transporter permease [Mycobacterium sp.]